MGAMAYQITNLTIVYSIVYSDADQRRHQSSASLAFVWGPVNSPHKWPVTRKMFIFDDVIKGTMPDIGLGGAFSLAVNDFARFSWPDNIIQNVIPLGTSSVQGWHIHALTMGNSIYHHAVKLYAKIRIMNRIQGRPPIQSNQPLTLETCFSSFHK